MAIGRFITIEGTEGAGKSTAVATVAAWAEQHAGSVITTREPGGTRLGEELREMLLRRREAGMAAETEVLLMFAARAEHLERVIRPALAGGQWVVCDRFTDASVAYQGYGRRLGADRVEALAQWLHADITPDLTLWLDVPVELGLQRAAGRSAPDRFEAEKARFFEAVREGYADLARRHPGRVHRIDATPELAEVTHTLQRTLETAFHGG